jgi:ABC-type transport system involved in Fe-S cluster assembly fused permease/ATPase subunit
VTMHAWPMPAGQLTRARLLQAIILNLGVVAALGAALLCSPGGVTPGDLVLIHGMLLQLWAPLQFLGWFFR